MQLDYRLKSGSENLDSILNGGFKTKAISEICGLPGSGKTQIWYVGFYFFHFASLTDLWFCSLQLCVMSQLPEECGGLNGSAIFIDTTYGFSLERYKGNIPIKCQIVIFFNGYFLYCIKQKSEMRFKKNIH
jgi:DNA repair protein RadA